MGVAGHWARVCHSPPWVGEVSCEMETLTRARVLHDTLYWNDEQDY